MLKAESISLPVVENDDVRTGQVDPKTTGMSREQEDEFLACYIHRWQQYPTYQK